MAPFQAVQESRSLLARAARHRLLLVTAAPALNGSVVTLAASGGLGDPLVLVGLALTGIGGAGAFTLASLEFGPRGDRPLLWAIAALSTVLIVSAALAGALLSAAERPWLRIGGGLAALAVAAQVAGLRVPTLRGVPAPLALAGAGAFLEVLS